MTATHLTEHWLQTVYQVVGRERLAFVSDIAQAIQQDETCRLADLHFETDGVQVRGRLTIRTLDARHLFDIPRRLRAVRGVVSVKKV